MSINRKDLIDISKSCINGDAPEYTYVCHPPKIAKNIRNNHMYNTCPCYNEVNIKERSNVFRPMPDYARKYNYKFDNPCPDKYQLQFDMPLLGKNNACPNISNFMDYSTFNRQAVIEGMKDIKNVKTNPNIFNGMTTLTYSPYKC